MSGPGPEFLFIRLPQSLSTLENGEVWVFFFFILLNITNQVNLTATTEILITGLLDIFKLSNTQRIPVVLSVGLVLLLLNSWMATVYHKEIINLLDLFFNSVYSAIITIWMVVPFAWVFGVDRLLSMIESSVGWCTTPLLSHPWWRAWWKLCWKFLAPTVYVTLTIVHLTLSFLTDQFEVKPWVNYTGLSLWAVGFFLISAPMVYLLVTTDKGGFTSRLRYLTTPMEKWGPVLTQHKHIMEIGEEDRLHPDESKEITVETYEELSLYMESRS